MTDSRFTIAEDFPPVSYEAWRAQVERELAGAPFDKLKTKLYGGVELEPLYTQAQFDHRGDPAGVPGAAPYTRGGRAAGESWEICAEQRHPDVLATGARMAEDLQNGADSILLCGFASEGGGPMIDSTDAMDAAFKDVPLDAAMIRFNAPLEYAAWAVLMAGVWRRRGVGADKARCAFNADPLAYLAQHGSLAAPCSHALAELAGLARWTHERFPLSTAVGVNSEACHNAGASDADELAFSMATGLAYLRAMLNAGMGVDDACRQMVFVQPMDSDEFANIAKLRAARRLWSRIAGACGASEAGRRMRQQAVTSRRAMQHYDPWTNMLRVTMGCFSAAAGGADIIAAAGFMKPFPLELGRRVARNTQIVLRDEARTGSVADPAGGSWYVESLTDDLSRRAWAVFQEIEKIGGMDVAMTGGWIGEKLDAVHAARMKNMAARRDPILGVTEFPNLEEARPRDEIDHGAITRRAMKRGDLSETRMRRIEGLEIEDFDALVDEAEAGIWFPPVYGPFRRKGSARMSMKARPERPPFDALRMRAEGETGHGVESGRQGRHVRPIVFMAKFGPQAARAAREAWCVNFFAAGGFGTEGGSFENSDAAAEGFKGSGAQFVIIVAPDKMHAELVPELAGKLKAAGAARVLLAGQPGGEREAWSAAGVDLFVHTGCDALAVLEEMMALENGK